MADAWDGGRTGEWRRKISEKGRNDGGLKEGGSIRVAGKWKAWEILQNRTVSLDVGLGEEARKNSRCLGTREFGGSSQCCGTP